MFSAPASPQNMPDCLRRRPVTADTEVLQMTKFYAAGPLDSGEERATHIHGPFTA